MTSQILKDLCDKVVSRNQLSLKEVVSRLRDFSLEQNVPAMAAYIATLESTNELDSAELLEAVFKYHSESRVIVDKFISLHESSEIALQCPDKIPNASLSFYEENGCLAAECTSGKWTKLANNVKAARIPWRYYQQNAEVSISSIESKLPLRIESDYFLTGETGSGKSTDAVRSLIGALNSGKTARYISCSDITDILENRASLKFERGYKAAVAVNHDNLKREMVDVDVLVIDEIVGISRYVLNALEQIVEFRFRGGKSTIYVSNHSFDKSSSLNNITITKVVGRRIGSRIRAAVSINYGYTDHRGAVKTGAETEAQILAQAENFKMPNLILAHPGTAHFPTFVGRNFIFKPISTQERKALTRKDKNGEIVEIARAGTDYATNVWSDGDSLHITGPVCDDGDAKALIALFTTLSLYHANGSCGSNLDINVSQVCAIQGIKPTGPNIAATKRRLKRLSLMSIFYKSGKKGHAFSGTFIQIQTENWNTKDSYMRISFNPSIAKLYLEEAFTQMTQYDKDATGISYVMKLFISTHKDHKVSVPNKKLLHMLGKDNLPKAKADKLLENNRSQIKKAGISLQYSSAAQSQTLSLLPAGSELSS